MKIGTLYRYLIIQAQMPFVWFYYFAQGLRYFFNRKIQAYSYIPRNSMNCLFYSEQLVNNLSSTSKRNIFWISPIILKFYAKYKYRIPLICTPLVFVSLPMLFQTSSISRTIFAILMIIVSNLSFFITYLNMNYQVIGWILIPVAMGLKSQDQVLFSSIILFISLYFTITPGVLTFPIMFLYPNNSPIFLIPYLMVFSLFIYRIFKSDTKQVGLKNLKAITSLIGVFKKNTLYKRTSGISSILHSYHYAILLFFFIIAVLNEKENATLILVLLLINLINDNFVRICDKENLFLLGIINLYYFIDLNNGSFIDLVLFYMFLNPPIGIIQNNIYARSRFTRIKRLKPYDFSIFINEVSDFFKAHKNKTFFVIYKNPSGSYDRLFDNMDYLQCALSYCARLHNVSLFPNWYSVSSEMADHGESIWCNSIDELGYILKRLKVSYFIDFNMYSASDLKKRLMKLEEIYSFTMDEEIVQFENESLSQINFYRTDISGSDLRNSEKRYHD